MLASRGGVYRREQSADFEAHPGCSCSVEPVWDREPDPPHIAALREEWNRVTAPYHGADKVRAWRRHRDRVRAAQRLAAQRAREAQLAAEVQAVAAAESAASAMGEISELIHNQASAGAMRDRVSKMGNRHGLPASLVDELTAAADDPRKLEKLIAEHARTLGVTKLGEAGQVVAFDRKVHAPMIPGMRLDIGQRVEIVRAGAMYRRGGDEFVLFKATVDEV